MCSVGALASMNSHACHSFVGQGRGVLNWFLGDWPALLDRLQCSNSIPSAYRICLCLVMFFGGIWMSLSEQVDEGTGNCAHVYHAYHAYVAACTLLCVQRPRGRRLQTKMLVTHGDIAASTLRCKRTGRYCVKAGAHCSCLRMHIDACNKHVLLS